VEADGAGVEGELAGAGAHEGAADADDVAEVEELVEVEEGLRFFGGGADVVFADVDLEALAGLLEDGEAGFALGAVGHDAAGDGGFDAVGVELFGGLEAAEGAELGDIDADGEAVGVAGFEVCGGGVEAARDFGGAGKFFLALGEELAFKGAVELRQFGSRFSWGKWSATIVGREEIRDSGGGSRDE
jgi:hypothetical protein